MKYKITMKRSYNEIEFIFKSLLDAAYFMRDAVENSKEDIYFVVEVITEEENTVEGESTDEE